MTEYRALALSAPYDPVITVLIGRAQAGRLVACAGAGLSMAPGAGLPSGRQLGGRLDARVREEWTNYQSPADPEDLIETADAAYLASGTLQPLQHLVLQLADFLAAAPNLGHRAIALLIAEGALQVVLLWNWDDCIERASPEGERISVLRSLEDLDDVSRPAVAKVHGCATRPGTLLITTEQLNNPPVWTDAAFRHRLGNATALFIGVGDIADYAERRLRELAESDLNLDTYLVSPSIETEWATTVWSDIYPLLEASHRLPFTADDFLDQLLRGWAKFLVDTYDRLTAGATLNGIEVVRSELLACDSETIVSWCRSMAMRKEIGVSLVHANATSEALVALAVLATDRGGQVRIMRGGLCTVDVHQVSVLTLPRPEPASRIQEEARRRAEHLAARGIGGPFTFLISGPIVGPIGATDKLDLIAASASDDLIHGPMSVEIEYLRATDFLGRVA